MNSFSLTETDEVNQPTATYVYTESAPGPGHAKGRIDRIPSDTPQPWSQARLVNILTDVFLPAGYPHSVSEDYLPYQIFDSLQAFCSSIAGLLASRAVLQGIGIGNPTATPTTALLHRTLQDTTSRLATILFAHRAGPALDPECKRYRLAADVFNDAGMVLNCLVPVVPGGWAGGVRAGVLCVAGVLQAACGVAGGSSKARLSAHFARGRSGNLGEVNAKDSSQETIISLLGMLTGTLVITHITSAAATWLTLCILLALHLALNHAAVRAVQMTTLNRQRANIVFSTLLESDGALLAVSGDGDGEGEGRGKILTPAQVAERESIFERDGAVKWHAPTSTPSSMPITLGTAKIGVSIHEYLCTTASTTANTTTSASASSPDSRSRSESGPPTLRELITLFSNEGYILSLSLSPPPATGTKPEPRTGYKSKATILLKQACTSRDQLKAWMHAILAMRVLSSSSSLSSGPGPSPSPVSEDQEGKGKDENEILQTLKQTMAVLNDGLRFEGYMRVLEENGWEVDCPVLETGGARRVSLR